MLGAIPSTVFRILGRKINIVFTILVVLFITGFAQADTIHVSTTGDDVNGDGSQGNPYATI